MAKVLAARAKKNLTITIHPSAESAYKFFRSQTFLFNAENFKYESVDRLYDGHIFSAIQMNKTEYALISGFATIGFSLSHINFQRQHLLIYDNLSDREIEQYAWKNVLRVLLTTLDNRHIESLRKSLNSLAPSSLIQDIFSSKALTQSQLADIALVSVSGLKKQKPDNSSPAFSQEKHLTPSPTNPHIFERLISEIKDDSSGD